MAAVYHDSPPHHHHHNNTRKQSTSASCCSPLRLWRTLQTIIHNDAKEEFARLCDTNPAELITRVLLTSRLSNDPALYTPSQKSRVIQFPIHVRQEAVRKFGKPATDLNALQLALLLKSFSIAFQLLLFLRQHASPAELSQFVNHVWGQRNTSLHLACFWNMHRLVRLLVDLGADTKVRNVRLVAPPDCCTNSECLALFSTTSPSSPPPSPATVTAPVPIPTPTKPAQTKPLQQRPSMLLKKAAERSMTTTLLPSSPSPSPQPRPQVIHHHDDSAAVAAITPAEYLDKKSPPPLAEDHHRAMMRMSPMSFSSSSSSSSFSSLSSIEEGTAKSDDLWTPPPSPMTIADKNAFPPSSPWSPTTVHDDTSVVVGFPPSPPSPVPTRPACFPSVRKIRSEVVEQHSQQLQEQQQQQQQHEEQQQEMESEQQHQPQSSPVPSAPPPQRRHVRFDPQVVLVDACTRGDLPELLSMIDAATHYMNDAYNRSLLHIALMNGHEKIAKCLIDSQKIDVNHADNNGWTAIHYASALGLWRCLEHLASLDQTNLHAKTYQGYSVHDCPVTEVDKRRCRLVIERALRRAKAAEATGARTSPTPAATKARATSCC
ncbi:hypothetical protein BDB00DRAFT_872214 [Zychaea mexicana]|uniref:uncharacterized protein n=1 Tax=Zychaea mexicana TaxID=64656 RepID=UPI0022FDE73E|nr:uncharacterized protein BDB00DRAFT_872214 [Zychaea mexicana]KAI9493535.1 hypothetical protein BDB00DRAFT_872214 [Zychaea mexicana]